MRLGQPLDGSMHAFGEEQLVPKAVAELDEHARLDELADVEPRARWVTPSSFAACGIVSAGVSNSASTSTPSKAEDRAVATRER